MIRRILVGLFAKARTEKSENQSRSAGINAQDEAALRASNQRLTVPIKNLAMVKPKAVVIDWWLAARATRRPCSAPHEMAAASLFTSRMKTSTIRAVDPTSRRVLTSSGHVYALAMPRTEYAVHARGLLTKLGF